MTPKDLAAFLSRTEIAGELIVLSVPTPTVETAAEAVGCRVEQIIKSVLFLIHDAPVLAIANGIQPIDQRAIAGHKGVGRRQVKLADAITVERITGYPVGGVPPFGHPQPIETLMDPGVLAQTEVYGGGGDHHSLLRLDPETIQRVTGAAIISLTGT